MDQINEIQDDIQMNFEPSLMNYIKLWLKSILGPKIHFNCPKIELTQNSNVPIRWSPA